MTTSYCSGTPFIELAASLPLDPDAEEENRTVDAAPKRVAGQRCPEMRGEEARRAVLVADAMEALVRTAAAR